ncbi:hypothetical protein GOP47_0013226 [Adiantum capillus-veneris]|uniref:Uncharacterized protein n=1 Tax=Adiantum capillus-veneris TaxID=13818 RepID=A0A9D4ZF38_ADICA|nr:hypothetical protein GOP47_0013226 [Adiantum capillus-veneris]
MASRMRVGMIINLLLLVYHLTLKVEGNMECEELSTQDCAFAVASSGARCVLEKHYVKDSKNINYNCQTSIIMAERGVIQWIETDACMKACGVTRLWVGLSTDALLERSFIQRLCLPSCKDHCPNIMDLFTKLAVEEGVYLPNLCNAMGEIFKEFTKSSKTTSMSRRELKEDKEASLTKQSLQDFDGFPHQPPFDSSAPYPQEPWMHAPPPFPFPFPFPPMAEPPYPPLEEPPFPYAQPPLPFLEEPPFPFGQPPYPYEPPYEQVEPPLPPQEGEPFIFLEPLIPRAPYAPPYFIEPPYYQQPPFNEPPNPKPNYNGEPPFPDYSATSPIFTQPEPTLMAPNLSPLYVGGGF